MTAIMLALLAVVPDTCLSDWFACREPAHDAVDACVSECWDPWEVEVKLCSVKRSLCRYHVDMVSFLPTCMGGPIAVEYQRCRVAESAEPVCVDVPEINATVCRTVESRTCETMDLPACVLWDADLDGDVDLRDVALEWRSFDG